MSDPARAELAGLAPDAPLAGAPGSASVAVVFAESAAQLGRILDAHRPELPSPAALWIAYPKANRADINRDSLWPILGEFGLRPITQVALDAEWSALRFRPPKPGEPEFTAGR